MITKINEQEFQTKVVNDPVAVVDFSATWCGPCRMLGPVLEEIAAEYDGRLKVGKVNVDEEQDLAMKFQVSAIPTVVLFKDGRPVDMFLGFRPKAAVEDFINSKL